MIVINGISATEGGALTVLNDFIEMFEGDAVCFCAIDPSFLPKKNNVRYLCVGPQRGFRRLMWDWFGLDWSLKRLNIRPKVCYSFNNMAPIIRDFHSHQHVVFFHQAIPLSDFKTSLVDKSLLRTLFYKKIYPLLVRGYDRPNVRYLVQAVWIKNALSCLCRIPLERISVERPCLNFSDVSLEKVSWFDEIDFIYPANDFEYKNHKLLIDTIDQIKDSQDAWDRRLVIGLTLTQDSWVFSAVKRKGLNEYFRFLGYQPRTDVLGAFAHGCGLVFPSLVETVGLPLLEAAHFGVPILASDLPFSRETLGPGGKCVFIDPEKPEKWAIGLTKIYSQEQLRECR